MGSEEEDEKGEERREKPGKGPCTARPRKKYHILLLLNCPNIH